MQWYCVKLAFTSLFILINQIGLFQGVRAAVDSFLRGIPSHLFDMPTIALTVLPRDSFDILNDLFGSCLGILYVS